MPSNLDKYLKKENFTSEQKEAMAKLAKSSQNVNEQSPSNTPQSHTPSPKDAGKRVAGVEDKKTKDSLAKYQSRQKSTVKAAGQTLQQQGVKPAKSPER